MLGLIVPKPTANISSPLKMCSIPGSPKELVTPKKARSTRKLHVLDELRHILQLGRKELANLLGVTDQKLGDYIYEEKRASAQVHTLVNFRLLFLFGVRPVYPWTGATLVTVQGADYDPAWYFAWSSIESLPQDDWMETKALEWELGYRVMVAAARYHWFEEQFIFPFEDADSVDWEWIMKKLQINPQKSLLDQRNRIVRDMIDAVPATSVEKLDIFRSISRDDIFAAVDAIGWLHAKAKEKIAMREDLAKTLDAFGLKKI